MSSRTPSAGTQSFLSAIEASVSTRVVLSVEGIRIIWLLDLRASIILEGARATRMNLDALPITSIILLRYAWRMCPRWSASSMTMSRLMGTLFGLASASLPDGAISPGVGLTIPLSNASRLILPARLSESEPPGLRNSSNDAIAPRCLARSRAWSTWEVAFHPGPSICLATSRQDAVFPTPAGPVISRCGGSEDVLADDRAWRTNSGTASSEKREGASDSSQLAMELGGSGGP